jgi:prepilin-type processing-associated H-X9-DG protein
MTDYAGGVWSAWHPYPEGFFRVGRVGWQVLDILDGTSNTLAISEKCLNRNQADFGPDWAWDFGPFCGADHDAMRATPRPPRPDYNGPVGGATWPLGYTPPGQDSDELFGSSHTGGVNVGFGDGSVRFVNYSVSASIWAAMGTRAGGESGVE